MILAGLLFFGFSVASAQVNLCPEPDGDFPNPASERCTTFFRCVNNTATLLRCPAMRTFDFLFRSCRPGTQVQCQRQLEIFAVPRDPPPLENPAPQASAIAALGVNPLSQVLGGAGGGATAREGGANGAGAVPRDLGAGLSGTGLLNILTLLEDGRRGRRRGRNDNDLLTMMVFSSLMNQMNSGFNGQQQQQPQQPPNQPRNQQQPQGQPHFNQLGQPWNQQPRLGPTPWNLPSRPRQQTRLLQPPQPLEPLPVVPDSGLLPASAVLPSAAHDVNYQDPDRNRKAVSVQEAGGQISRLPDGKTVVIIPQPAQTN